jgi:hypothetical protein
MKKLKIFKEPNDYAINSFLEQSKGKIKAYNPIVIEYDDKNIDYQSFISTDDFIVIGARAKFDFYKDSSKMENNATIIDNFNRITINKLKKSITLYNNDKIVLNNVIINESNHLYMTIWKTIHPTDGFKSLSVGLYFWDDVAHRDIREIEEYFNKELKKIN